MAERAQILIRAKDETAQAFGSVRSNINGTVGAVQGLIPQLAAAFSIGGILAFTKTAIDAGDEMKTFSEKTGLSVERLSELRHVANQSDTDMDTLVMGMRQLSVNMQDAARGTGDAHTALRALGVAVTEPSGRLRDMDAVLADVAEQFAGMKDGADKSALAANIFGNRVGTQLIPFLNRGRDGIAELSEEARRLGLVMSTEAAEAADQLNDSLALISASSRSMATQLLNSTAPALAEIARQMAETTKQSGFLAGALRGYGEAWKLMIFGSKDEIKEQRQLIREIEKDLDKAQKNLAWVEKAGPLGRLAHKSAQEYRMEIGRLTMALEQANNALRIMEELASNTARPPDQRKDAPALESESERKAKETERQRAIKERLEWGKKLAEQAARDEQMINDAIEVGREARAKRMEDEAAWLAMVEESRLQQEFAIRETIGLREQEAQALWEQTGRKTLSVLEGLNTEREAMRLDFNERMAILQAGYDQQIITEKTFQDRRLRLIAQYNSQVKLAEWQKNQAIRAMQIQTWQLGAELLASLPGQSKAAALAVIAINKGLAAAQVVQNTAVGVMRAFAELGPIAGVPAAAAIKTLGAIQLGLIAASGLLQGYQVVSGGVAPPQGTFDADPATGLPTESATFAPPGSPFEPQRAQAPARNVTITLVGEGTVSTSWIRDVLIPSINEAVGDGVNLVTQ